MSQVVRFSIICLFLVGVYGMILWPRLFGIATFFASIIVFGRIEYEKNRHAIGYFTIGDMPTSARRWLLSYSFVEVIVRSAIFGILAVLLFSGTDNIRINILALLFTASILAGYYCLRFIQRFAYIDAVRWGYIKLSVVLGVIFSILSATVPGMKITDIVLNTARGTLRQPSFDEFAELLYGLLSQLNSFITNTLQILFGDFLGWCFSLIISVNVIYGFVVLVYSLLLLRLIPAELAINSRKLRT